MSELYIAYNGADGAIAASLILEYFKECSLGHKAYYKFDDVHVLEETFIDTTYDLMGDADYDDVSIYINCEDEKFIKSINNYYVDDYSVAGRLTCWFNTKGDALQFVKSSRLYVSIDPNSSVTDLVYKWISKSFGLSEEYAEKLKPEFLKEFNKYIKEAHNTDTLFHAFWNNHNVPVKVNTFDNTLIK